MAVFSRLLAQPIVFLCIWLSVLLAAYTSLLVTVNFLSLFLILLAIGAVLAAGLVLTVRRKIKAFTHLLPAVIVCGAIYVITLSYFDARVQQIIDGQLPSELESTDVLVEGVVGTHPEGEGKYRRFIFKVHSLRQMTAADKSDFKGNIRLSWLAENSALPGDLLHLKVRLKRPRGFVNPGGFDYQRWLLEKNILATGYVKSIESIPRDQWPSSESFFLRQYGKLHSYRHRFVLNLDASLGSLSHSALIKALLVGDKSDITSSQWALFQATGTIHLMAISGLHVGMVCGFVLLLFGLLRKPLSLVFGPSSLSVLAYGLCSLSACFYAFLAGFSVPTQRATLCVILIGAAFLIGKRTHFLYVLALVAIVVACRMPFALLSSGFVLSFAAVAVLLLGLGQRYGGSSRIVAFFKAQFIILFALSPFLLLLNLPLAVSAPIANTLAIPLITFVILPLLFLAAIAMPVSNACADMCFQAANFLLALLEGALDSLSTPLYFFNADSFVVCLALFSAAALYLLPGAFRLKVYAYLISALLISTQILSPQSFKQHKAPFKMTVLDVGQGLSAVIDDGSRTLIYDIGAKFSDSFSVADRVLLPFLQRQGFRHQMEIVISHADNDHAGDFDHFISSIEPYSKAPLRITSGEPEKLQLSDAHTCAVGDNLLSVAGARARVLWPLVRPALDLENVVDSGISNMKANNRSCVVLITIKDFKILLMGDVEKEVEYRLLNMQSLPQNIDVLIAPHHGSATSSTSRLVNWLNPKHVVVSAGYKNRYGHPSETVLQRYRVAGTQVWNTAVHGAISIVVDDEVFVLRSERCTKPKRWYLKGQHCMNQNSS